MAKIKWDRPSGRTLETNDKKETIEYLKSIGYTISKPKRKKPAAKEE